MEGRPVLGVPAGIARAGRHRAVRAVRLAGPLPGGSRDAGGALDAGELLDAVADGDLLVLGKTRQQLPVQPAPPQQLVVGADIDDTPFVKDGDPVGEVERRAAVGDEERRAPRHDPPEGVVDPLLDGGVDGTRRIVEDEDPRL